MRPGGAPTRIETRTPGHRAGTPKPWSEVATITEDDVAELLDAGIIDPATAGRIGAYLQEHGRRRETPGPETPAAEPGKAAPAFDLAHAAYWLGAAVILFALAWFASEAWQRYGGWPLAIVAAAYAGLFAGLGQLLWARWRIPGGLLFTAAIAMTPLFVFAVQSGLGAWPGPGEPWPQEQYLTVSAHRVTIELVTLWVALIVVRVRPFAFHAVVVAAAVYALALDLGPALVGPLSTDEAQQVVILTAGLLLLASAYLLDHRTGEDYALWLYLAGLAGYWFLLTALHHDQVRYLLTNLFFIALAVLIRRRAFLVAGGFGIFVYLMYLAGEVFRDSLLFPVALSVIGLAFILGGVAFAQRQDRARRWLLDRLPASLRDGLPQSRGQAGDGG